MAKLDARRLAAFLQDPGPGWRVALLHGDDAGLVRERAETLLRAVVAPDDPFGLVEVPRDAAAKDPGLLAAEAATPSLGGGRRAVRVRDVTDGLAAAAKEALAGRGPGLVVLEAGELPARSRLRALLEPAEAAAVIACYRERGADLAASIGRLLRELGAGAVEPAALEWLAGRLGEDRLLMRRELEKLALYAGAGGTVTEEMALACLAEGGAGALDLDEALMAAMTGDLATADRALDAAFAEGATGVGVVRAALRQVQRLHLAALQVAAGMAPAAAAAGLRPPVFFRHRPAFERALRLWRPEQLAAAGAALLEAERRTKTTGMPDAAIARGAVLALARQAAQARR
ncbi:DNA polymerase III subunit delta [Caldovatus aquaticus]|uniref:DNA-directed DNA polymerase n=1 Tax=Caldovatus aquaticus TaxID=2865671 RepID=A0ABS7F5S1_9PROT|nr:DNA polymerase III subunit delta [Caldovatus aquaticus]